MLNIYRSISTHKGWLTLETKDYCYPQSTLSLKYKERDKTERSMFIRVFYSEGQMVFTSKNPPSKWAISMLQEEFGINPKLNTWQ